MFDEKVCRSDLKVDNFLGKDPNFFRQKLPPVLPDGIFSDQKCQFWYIFEGLWMDNIGVLHGHFIFLLLFYIYFMTTWYVCGHFGTFPPNFSFFLHQEKSGSLGCRLIFRLGINLLKMLFKFHIIPCFLLSKMRFADHVCKC
jgi:hypothetical protein